MLLSITLIPQGDVSTLPDYDIVYRGTMANNGSPFVYSDEDVAYEDVEDQVSTTLQSQSLNWGVVDDIT